MQDMRMVKQLGGGTGEEALRVVRLLKFKKPELPILTSLPIVFKLGADGLERDGRHNKPVLPRRMRNEVMKYG